MVFDGRRIAYRADPIGPHARTWVPMKSVVSVIDEAPDTLAVFIDGVRLRTATSELHVNFGTGAHSRPHCFHSAISKVSLCRLGRPIKAFWGKN